ncbi:RNA polymerase II transcription elongation factor SpEAF [Schizosaccharomyces japonicus yFS275]|uniref:RNA polymerase II transcription elongation factor SpEAF n=1 Tax=Schizosaccharomyces japonicus (strain yFS275 / FY16936) TaxID=402676 RepID=B6K4C5_SCHJY|nr:RNA polymerase II transcription elongation factor SpEAF [Schizosaccharomyces japonicus yFS275]EEB08332.1 RNA polymerase II transcription elongation factor SpEAF [Schizosaccharomyces japonicus yFS275]
MYSLPHGSYDVVPGRSFRGSRKDALVAIKYNFKPDSIDNTKQGQLDKNKDNTFTLQLPSSSDPQECHSFQGQAQQARNVDCVLTFDPETQTFTLDHLDSVIRFNALRNRAKSTRVKSGTSGGNGSSADENDNTTLALPTPSSTGVISPTSTGASTPSTTGPAAADDTGASGSSPLNSQPHSATPIQVPDTYPTAAPTAISPPPASRRPSSHDTGAAAPLRSSASTRGGRGGRASAAAAAAAASRVVEDTNTIEIIPNGDEEEEESELDDFAKELESGLAQDFHEIPAPTSQPPTGKPISLRNLSRGSSARSYFSDNSSSSEED